MTDFIIQATKKAWTDIMTPLGILSHEAHMSVTKAGMTLKSIDGSHVSMAFADIRSADFQSFVVRKKQKVGIDMSNFLKAIKRFDKADAIELRYEGTQFLITKVVETGTDQVITMKPSDPERMTDTDPAFPQIAFDTSLLIQTSLVNEAI